MMTNCLFSENFIWGAGTSAYQVEGAWNLDGKGESIWDRFSHTPGKIKAGDTGDISCDNYSLFRKDIEVMKEIGLKSYRFSISWPRIFPDGGNTINLKGLNFYKRLAEELLKNGITPNVTIYHWDLPQKLQDKGGWVNRETVGRFEEYAAYLFKNLNDYVKIWTTINEPWVVAFLGHYKGVHAPGITDFSAALQAAHHLMLAHGKTINIFKQGGFDGEIGIVLDLTPVYPASASDMDISAVKREDGFINRWFLDPIFKGTYPEDMMDWISQRAVLPSILEGDMNTINSPVDFLGINYYTSSHTKRDQSCWPFETDDVYSGRDRSDMDWEIHPEGLFDLLLRLKSDYGNIKFIICENGMASNDIVNRFGEIEDMNRIDYLEKHLKSLHKAISKGVDIRGYYVWSLLDNFEWAQGFSKRFGLVYVDHGKGSRILKKSAYWYKDVIGRNGLV